jgi:hypothetical protein
MGVLGGGFIGGGFINGGSAGGGGLPTQSGNAGRVLTTDGTTASWTNTLASKTINGSTTLDGTATAAPTATLALVAALGVTVPPRLLSDSSAAAASTAFVQGVVAAAVAGGILPAYYTTAGVGPTVSGTGLATYISVTTPSLAAGTYSVSAAVTCSHTATGSSAGVQLTVGATPVPTATIDGGASVGSGGRSNIRPFGYYTHAGGTLALLVQVRRSSGSGNIIPQAGSIELRRVA